MLFGYKRQESEEPSAFDGNGKPALILGGQSGAATAGNTTVGIEKLFQNLYILIVYIFDIVG